jgi:hypothetical protein
MVRSRLRCTPLPARNSDRAPVKVDISEELIITLEPGEVPTRGDINPEPERVSGGQWNGPGGVWFASWPTASVMRRQTAAPL